jgi:hypothetical protein
VLNLDDISDVVSVNEERIYDGGYQGCGISNMGLSKHIFLAWLPASNHICDRIENRSYQLIVYVHLKFNRYIFHRLLLSGEYFIYLGLVG